METNYFTVRAVLRTDKIRKNGTCPIYIVLQRNNVTQKLSLSEFIEELILVFVFAKVFSFFVSWHITLSGSVKSEEATSAESSATPWVEVAFSSIIGECLISSYAVLSSIKQSLKNRISSSGKRLSHSNTVNNTKLNHHIIKYNTKLTLKGNSLILYL